MLFLSGDSKTFLLAAINVATTNTSESKMAEVYFEASFILSEILDHTNALDEAIQLLITAVKNAETYQYWHLKLIFKLSVWHLYITRSKILYKKL